MAGERSASSRSLPPEQRSARAQLAALLSILAPTASDHGESTEALVAYVLTAAREPMAKVSYGALIQGCATLDDLASEALGRPLSRAEPGEVGELLCVCAIEAPSHWRPFLGGLTLMAFEGLLYGERPESGAVWRAIGHPWAAAGEDEPS